MEFSAKAEDLTKESYQLARKKATEILTFLLSTTDREKSIHGIDNIPVAYALKGHSLSTETMRRMIEDVRNKCKEKGVNILCETCDGQCHKMFLVISTMNL